MTEQRNKRELQLHCSLPNIEANIANPNESKTSHTPTTCSLATQFDGTVQNRHELFQSIFQVLPEDYYGQPATERI